MTWFRKLLRKGEDEMKPGLICTVRDLPKDPGLREELKKNLTVRQSSLFREKGPEKDSENETLKKVEELVAKSGIKEPIVLGDVSRPVAEKPDIEKVVPGLIPPPLVVNLFKDEISIQIALKVLEGNKSVTEITEAMMASGYVLKSKQEQKAAYGQRIPYVVTILKKNGYNIKNVKRRYVVEK